MRDCFTFYVLHYIVPLNGPTVLLDHYFSINATESNSHDKTRLNSPKHNSNQLNTICQEYPRPEASLLTWSEFIKHVKQWLCIQGGKFPKTSMHGKRGKGFPV